MVLVTGIKSIGDKNLFLTSRLVSEVFTFPERIFEPPGVNSVSSNKYLHSRLHIKNGQISTNIKEKIYTCY